MINKWLYAKDKIIALVLGGLLYLCLIGLTLSCIVFAGVANGSANLHLLGFVLITILTAIINSTDFKSPKFGRVLVYPPLFLLCLFAVAVNIGFNSFENFVDLTLKCGRPTNQQINQASIDEVNRFLQKRALDEREARIKTNTALLLELKRQVIEEIEYYNKHDTLSGSSDVVYKYQRIEGAIDGDFKLQNSNNSRFLAIFGFGFGRANNNLEANGSIHGTIDTERVKHCNTNGNEEPILSTEFKLIDDAVEIQSWTKKNITDRILKIVGTNLSHQERFAYKQI